MVWMVDGKVEERSCNKLVMTIVAPPGRHARTTHAPLEIELVKGMMQMVAKAGKASVMSSLFSHKGNKGVFVRVKAAIIIHR